MYDYNIVEEFCPGTVGLRSKEAAGCIVSPGSSSARQNSPFPKVAAFPGSIPMQDEEEKISISAIKSMMREAFREGMQAVRSVTKELKQGIQDERGEREREAKDMKVRLDVVEENLGGLTTIMNVARDDILCVVGGFPEIDINDAITKV